jgi:hypothetical protein
MVDANAATPQALLYALRFNGLDIPVRIVIAKGAG